MTEKTSNVLVISTRFPPDHAGAVIRVAKLVKYLPHFGWRPTILTGNDGVEKRQCEDLLRDVAGATAIRVPACDPRKAYGYVRRLFSRRRSQSVSAIDVRKVEATGSLAGRWLIPDYMVFWAFIAVPVGLYQIFRRNIDVIFASGPPHSALVVGAILSWMTRVPFVADLRDAWTTNARYERRALEFLEWMDRWIERRTLSAASSIVVVSFEFIEQICERFPALRNSHFVNVPNGFDPDDFVGLVPKREERHFTIVHTGNLYWPVTPDSFIKGCLLAVERRPELAKILKVKFIGAMPTGWREACEDRPEMFAHEERRSHKECLELNLGADVLLLIPGPGAGVMTGKVYEYIASGRPILALVKPERLSKLVTDNGLGAVVDPDDVPSIAKAIEGLFERRLSDFAPTVRGVSDFYNRKMQVATIAELLSSLVQPK